MKKIFIAFILIFLFQVPAYAQNSYVFDQAGLFKEDEIESLEQAADELSAKYKQCFAIVTTDDAEGKSAREYADDFYGYILESEYKEKGGALYLIDMDNREAYISTAGDGRLFLTDERIEDILDFSVPYLSDGEYTASATAFLENTEKWYVNGIPENQYTYDEETGEIVKYHSLNFGWVAFAVLISGGLFCIIFFSVKNSYEAPDSYAYPFMYKSRLELRRNDEVLANKYVTTRKIVQSTSTAGSSGSSSGKRSSVHRSSSGRSHGGGGRRF